MKISLSAQLHFFSYISFQEKMFFTKHLATMIKAGIPLVEALESLLEQTNNLSFKKILEQSVFDIKNGRDLADSLGKYPPVFDQFYLSMIKIGEKSGTLEENLEFLAKHLKKSYNLNQKIRGAMMYPGLVFLATSIMGGFISLYVLPKLVDFFTAFQIDLPITTKILLFVARIMRDYGVLIFATLIGLGILINFLIKIRKIKLIWHQLLLKLPLFGKMVLYGQLARFARNMGVLIKSGIPIDDGFEITAKTMGNLIFERDVADIGRSLIKGKDIAKIMEAKKYPEFPMLVYKMIAVGEKTGKLEDTFIYLGDFYEEEIDNIAKNLSTILEPFLLLVIGLVVAFVALAIISPIYQLTGSIRR